MKQQWILHIPSHRSHSVLTYLYLRLSSLFSSGGWRTRFTSSSKISGLIKLKNQAKKLINTLCASSVLKQITFKQFDLLSLTHVIHLCLLLHSRVPWLLDPMYHCKTNWSSSKVFNQKGHSYTKFPLYWRNILIISTSAPPQTNVRQTVLFVIAPSRSPLTLSGVIISFRFSSTWW